MKHRRCPCKDADVARKLKWRLTEVSDTDFACECVGYFYLLTFMLFIHDNIYFASSRDEKYYDEHVCLSVHLLVYMHLSKTTRPNFTKGTCYPGLWLSPLLKTMEYVMYFCRMTNYELLR